MYRLEGAVVGGAVLVKRPSGLRLESEHLGEGEGQDEGEGEGWNGQVGSALRASTLRRDGSSYTYTHGRRHALPPPPPPPPTAPLGRVAAGWGVRTRRVGVTEMTPR